MCTISLTVVLHGSESKVQDGAQEENFIIHFWILVKIKMFSFYVKLVYLVVITVQLASQQSIYYVIPGNGTRVDSTGETVCHPGNAQCSTLADLLQHNTVEHQYSNHSSCLLDTRIVLLPGIHDISADSNTLFNVNCSENLVITALDLASWCNNKLQWINRIRIQPCRQPINSWSDIWELWFLVNSTSAVHISFSGWGYGHWYKQRCDQG